MPIHVHIHPVGKTLAYTSIKFRTSDNGPVFARGSHTKYVTKAWKDPNNIVEELAAEEKTQSK
jgi:acyl-coenzyme A thioesterase 13